MMTYDLRIQLITLDELFQIAANEPIQIIAKDGLTFVVESIDTFTQEVRTLGQSKKFMTFLAERAREPATISLDELDREIDEQLARE